MRGPIAIAALAALLAVAAPRPLGAEELHLGWATSFEYDDNIFNTDEDSEQNQEEDVAFRTGPLLELRREQGDFTYRAEYALRWESFIDESGLDAFDHNINFQGTLRLGPRTQLEVAEQFALTRSLNRVFEFDAGEIVTDPVLEEDPDFEPDRSRLKRNTASARLIHQFTRRLEGRLSLSHRLFRSNREFALDNDTISAVGSLGYSLSTRDRVGFGFGVTQQSFEDAVGEENTTLFYRLFGTWSHVFDPSMSLSIQAGPTLVVPDDDDGLFFSVVQDVQAFPFRNTPSGGVRLIDPATCPTVEDETMQPFSSSRCDVFPAEVAEGTPLANFLQGQPEPDLPVAQDDEGADNSLTFFADISFSKQWESWSTRLSFRRSDSTSSGQGGSTILNVFSAQAVWEPARWWRVTLNGAYTTRESATDQLQTVVGLGRIDFCVDAAGAAITALPGACPAGTSVVPGSFSESFRRFETDETFESETLRGSLRIQRELGRRTNAFLALTYLMQERDDLNSDRTLKNFRAMVGVRWWLDPLHL